MRGGLGTRRPVARRAAGCVLALGLVAGASGCSGVDTGFGQEQITVFTTPGYEDTTGVTLLWVELLAERDIALEVVNVDLAAGFASIARGSVDGQLNTWLPTTHAAYVEDYEDSVVILDDDGGFYDNNQLLLAVPEYSDAETIDDVVADPEAFNSEIIGIEAGSGLMSALPETLEAYDAGDDFEVVSGSTPAMLASLERAIGQEEDILVTLWTPHWAFDNLPIKPLEDPQQGWPEADTSYVTVSEDFAEEHPEIAGWFSNMELNDEQFASLMYEVGQGPDDPREGVRAWLDDPENRATTDEWFD